MSAERKRSRKSSDEFEDAQEDPEVQPDSFLLQEFVPEEVWELVSKKVLEAGSKDHQHLVNSSQFFQNMRACQIPRTTYLFEQVFPLVAKSVWRKEGLEGFPVADVLNCRAVCKEWNAVIDKVIPEFTSLDQRYQDSEDELIGHEFYRIERNEFDDDENVYLTTGAENSIQDFMQYFEPTHDPANPSKARNPFIWGKVKLCIHPPDDEDDDDEQVAAYHRYLEGVISMLSKYGKFVHSFKLDTELYIFENLSLFNDWLLLMPNLKEIKVSIWYKESEEINEYPFPELRFLEKITINSLPPQLFNQLIQQNSHISKLFLMNPEDCNVFTVALPNLKEFGTEDSPDDIVEKLASLQAHWPLESLELGKIRLIAFVPLFRLIQDKFADTLVSLSLEICFDDADEVDGSLELWQYCKDCTLDLPKLKKIKFDFGIRPVCLDFLLPMKNNLEEISASYCGDLELCQDVTLDTSGIIVQFSGLENEMLESNIWSIFNKLEKLEVTSCVAPDFCYIRKDWMLKLNSKCA